MPLKERPRGTNLSHSLYVQQSTVATDMCLPGEEPVVLPVALNSLLVKQQVVVHVYRLRCHEGCLIWHVDEICQDVLHTAHRWELAAR